MPEAFHFSPHCFTVGLLLTLCTKDPTLKFTRADLWAFWNIWTTVLLLYSFPYICNHNCNSAISVKFPILHFLNVTRPGSRVYLLFSLIITQPRLLFRVLDCWNAIHCTCFWLVLLIFWELGMICIKPLNFSHIQCFFKTFWLISLNHTELFIKRGWLCRGKKKACLLGVGLNCVEWSDVT